MRNRLLGNHSIFDGRQDPKFTKPDPVPAFYRKSITIAPTPTKQQCRPEYVRPAICKLLTTYVVPHPFHFLFCPSTLDSAVAPVQRSVHDSNSCSRPHSSHSKAAGCAACPGFLSEHRAHTSMARGAGSATFSPSFAQPFRRNSYLVEQRIHGPLNNQNLSREVSVGKEGRCTPT